MTTNSKIRTAATATTSDNAASQTAFYATAGVATLIGLWASACFVGLILSEGPIAMVGSWFSAVAGI